VDKHTLFFLSSNYILYYISTHPILWHDRAPAQRGGLGDQAGMTPTPAVEEFMSLLNTNRDLFTQEEYARSCIAKWQPWFDELTPNRQKGVLAKLYNNFYPAMIDALHVFAMLVENRDFDIYLIDAAVDVHDKTDLVLVWDHQVFRIALYGPTHEAKQNRAFKVEHRPGMHDDGVIAIQLPAGRPKDPGNKRWFQSEDLLPLYRAMQQSSDELLGT
jgi:hypothetical protein